MAIGPGKYDDVCTVAREMADAQLVTVIVMGGNKGGGFSVQTTLYGFQLLAMLPAMLRQVADEIERGMPQT
jgi:hypothetical protein